MNNEQETIENVQELFDRTLYEKGRKHIIILIAFSIFISLFSIISTGLTIGIAINSLISLVLFIYVYKKNPLAIKLSKIRVVISVVLQVIDVISVLFSLTGELPLSFIMLIIFLYLLNFGFLYYNYFVFFRSDSVKYYFNH